MRSAWALLLLLVPPLLAVLLLACQPLLPACCCYPAGQYDAAPLAHALAPLRTAQGWGWQGRSLRQVPRTTALRHAARASFHPRLR